MRTSMTTLGLLLAIQLLSATAHAWSMDGHRAVGVIAWQQLDRESRQAVSELLGPGLETFAEGCAWPDRVKYTPEYQLTRPLHYVNVPRGEAYDPERHCREGNCLPEALRSQTTILRNPDAPAALRVEALKFVCHFVGDLHQPLHIGYAHDRGGNDQDVPLGPITINLHEFWDRVIPGFMGGWRDIADSSAEACSPAREPADIDDWVAESRALLETPGLLYPSVATPDGEWMGEGVALARQRICLAGHRLAWMLDSLLARAEAGR